MSTHVGHGEAQVLPRPEAVDGFWHLEREWDALAERSGSIFATALWSKLWWEHFGGDRELLLHAVRSDDGSLGAVLPLYAWRHRLPRVLRFLGHGTGDELGPVHAPDAHAAAARVLRGALDALDWDVFFGEQLPGDEDWPELLDGPTWRREASPLLRLPATWDEYLAERSSNFRDQLRRRRAGLERAGNVVTRLAEEETLERDLDTLFALHRARWSSTTTDFGDTPFHRELARAALARGWLRLWLLELDGRAVAAWHGFHVGSVASYYQAGRDPSVERQSVGFVLMAHTIRSAMAEGATEYRFGRGDEAFKARFASGDPELETVVLRRGAIGASAYASARAARGTRNRVRQTLRVARSGLRRATRPSGPA
jgi:CelD/BcsL family acetyltransferase involved in cellulose biosynthesis